MVIPAAYLEHEIVNLYPFTTLELSIYESITSLNILIFNLQKKDASENDKLLVTPLNTSHAEAEVL